MKRWITWGFVGALAATLGCEDGVGGDGDRSCEGATATLYGAVGYSEATGEELVFRSGSESVTAEIEDDRTWSVAVTGGRTWSVSGRFRYDEGSDSGVYGDLGCTCTMEADGIEVAGCDDAVEVDLEVLCLCADKPNLYLYPPIDTPTSVTIRHGPDQRVFASAPPYGEGWKGTAHPDGTFTPEGGAKSPFLFCEITVPGRLMKAVSRDTVFCFGPDQIVQDLANLLGIYGFNAREQKDFVDGWASGFPKLGSYAVYPQTRVDAMAPLDVRPNVPIHRLWLLVEPGAGCVPSGGTIAPFERRGAHGVEWGVLYDRRHGLDAR